MHPLAELVRAKEDWLIEQVLASARRLGYTRFTSTLMEAWRTSVQGLSEAFIQTLASPSLTFDFTPDYNPVQDPVAYFGIIEAQRHRARGVTLEQYLGLMKYYRRAYYGLLTGTGMTAAQVRQGHRFIEQFFDRLELGVSSEWTRITTDGFIEELRRVNRAMTNEKNRLLTLIESLPNPLLYFDVAGALQLFNRAAAEQLEVGRDAGGNPWMSLEFAGAFRGVMLGLLTGEVTTQLCTLPTRDGLKILQLQAAPVQDVTSKHAGVLVSLSDPQSVAAAGRLSEVPLSPAPPPVTAASVPPPADLRYRDLMLLYRVSNSMLTTLRLNKLIHVVLTALTAGDEPFFDRAMLFLTNERSGYLQGMLGVTRETSASLSARVTDPADVLGSGWEISEELMLRQQDAEFSRLVRGSRLELDKRLNVSSRAVLEKRLIHVREVAREKRIDAELAAKFGITSFAVAPLIAKERVFGVVVVDNGLSERRIRQSDLGFLQILTNQAGVAIENSLLYSRLEEANRNLREAQERLIHGERLATIGEMAASLAHELKGPLVSIGGFAKRLLKGLPASGTQHDAAEMIAKEVQRLEKLLGDILSFGRKATLCYDHCIVQDLVEDSLAVVAPTCTEHRIQIRRKFAAKPIALLADGQQLKQVFLNLFFNAQEAMVSKERGGVLAVSIALTRLRGAPAVTIKVSDSGGGVPEPQLHNIFTAFYTTKESGTGLGLPIAHRIISNHRGTILARNLPEMGLEFTITLPLQPQ